MIICDLEAALVLFIYNLYVFVYLIFVSFLYYFHAECGNLDGYFFIDLFMLFVWKFLRDWVN